MKLLIILTFLGFSKGDVGYNFLTLPYGYDGAVFRSAEVVNTSSPYADFYNPSIFPNTRASTFVSSYLVGIKYGGFSYAVEPDLRVGAFFITTGAIDKTNEEGIKVGTYSSNYIALFGRYRPIKDFEFYGYSFKTGAGVKLIYQGIDKDNSIAVAADGGLHAKITNLITFGVSVTNLGYEIKPFVEKRYFLPLQVALGVSVTPTSKLKILASGGFELGYGAIFDVGADFSPIKPLSIRLGYALKGKDLNTGGTWDVFNGFSAGVAIFVKNISLGYTILPMGELGITHFIGVNF